MYDIKIFNGINNPEIQYILSFPKKEDVPEEILELVSSEKEGYDGETDAYIEAPEWDRAFRFLSTNTNIKWIISRHTPRDFECWKFIGRLSPGEVWDETVSTKYDGPKQESSKFIRRTLERK